MATTPPRGVAMPDKANSAPRALPVATTIAPKGTLVRVNCRQAAAMPPKGSAA